LRHAEVAERVEIRKVGAGVVFASAGSGGELGDEIEALRHAVKHLHLNGHRRIGWIGHRRNGEHDDALLEPLRAELHANGLALDSRYVAIQPHDDRAAGAEAIFTLIDHQRRRDFPTAFVCRNCLMASGAVTALKRERWSVPADISVVGADHPGSNGNGASHITGAGPDPLRVGATAAQLLVNPLRNPEPGPSANGQGRHKDNLVSGNGRVKDDLAANGRSEYVDVLVPAELVVGSSSGPAPL
jgi:DNA-binding LacI/PurR family transcriptional regulator